MRDAVDLIGQTISIGALNYTFVNVYFLPDALSKEHSLYFSLKKSDGTLVNYSYFSLLPYMQKSIKL